MGLFWDYFRDTLRLPFIQKPGPLAMLAEGGAAGLDASRSDMLVLRDQFFPTRCEDVYLVRFARSRGIIRSPLEPDEHWLARVRFAYHWWSRGGRASAMAEALIIGFGFDAVQIVNMRSDDPLKWASFRVILEGGTGDILLRHDQIKWAVNEVKPARSKLIGLKFYAPQQRLERNLCIATRTGELTTIYPQSPSDLQFTAAGTYYGTTCKTGTITTIHPGEQL